MKNILVAIDGSETSKKALMEARDLAECKGSIVKIIHVKRRLGPPTGYGCSEGASKRYHEISVDREKESKVLLEDALKIFEGFPREVETVSRTGDPAEEIIKEAEDGKHDLIVMGNRGSGTFSRAILGSVSNKVLNHSDEHVLIIK